jgi:hypothetical protein
MRNGITELDQVLEEDIIFIHFAPEYQQEVLNCIHYASKTTSMHILREFVLTVILSLKIMASAKLS